GLKPRTCPADVLNLGESFGIIINRIEGKRAAWGTGREMGDLQPTVYPTLGTVFGPANIASVLAWDVDPHASEARIATVLRSIPPPLRSAVAATVWSMPAKSATSARPRPAWHCCTSDCTLAPAGTTCRRRRR